MTDKSVPDELMDTAVEASNQYTGRTPFGEQTWSGQVQAILAVVVPKVRADERAKVYAELFGTPEEIAARRAEPLKRDDPVDLCERVAPGQHVASERMAIIEGIKDYFAAVDDPLYDDVMTLCGRIERGEYSRSIRGDR